MSKTTLKWNWVDAIFLLILLLLVVGMAVRYTPHVTSSIPGMWWDPLLNTWTLTWDVTALLHNPLHLWQAPLLYPYNLTLSYSEALFGDLIYFAPVYLISHNPVLAYNFTFYSILFLDGLTMYITARAYTQKRFAAFIAALIFAFAPYRISQIDHIPVTGAMWIPLAFLFLDRSFQDGRWRNWILLALFFLLQLLSSIYYGIFLTYTLIAYVLVRYSKPFVQQLLLHKGVYLKNLLKLAIKPVVIFAVTLVLLVVLMAPYLISLHNGYSRSEMQSATYSAFITDFFYTNPFNLLHGISSMHGVTIALDGEHFLFVGWTVMILSAIGVILAFQRHDTTMRAYIWTGLIVLLFAFGPFLQFTTSFHGPLPSGIAVTSPYWPGIPMPWYIAFYILPGFKGLRVPSRLVGVVLMMLALLGAYVVAWLQNELQEHLARRSARGNEGSRQESLSNQNAALSGRQMAFRTIALNVVLILIPLALLAEALPAYLPITAVPAGNAVPQVYQWLATHGGTQPMIELPMSTPQTQGNFSDKDEAWYDYYTIYHHHPIVNGWEGYRPPITVSISELMLSFPSAASISILQKYHVTYVVFHAGLYLQYENTGQVNATLTHMQANAHLRLLASFGKSLASGDSVWQVV
jgi:hypothetical protein